MTTRKRPGWPFWITVAVLGLPVLYVLSIGPAWMMSTMPRGGNYIPNFYAPLVRFVNPYPPLAQALIWYLHLWAP